MSKNERLYAKAKKVLPGGNTRTTLFLPPSPPYAAYGRGANVIDEDGHETIDCNNNYTALIHGHTFPPAMDAARRALEKGTAFGLPTAYEIDLAETLSKRIRGMEQWRFCNSGTEAVMQAIRVARAATGRELIIRFARSYHGTSDAVLDPNLPGVPAGILDSVISLPVGDSAAFEEALQGVGSRLAGVVVDLMPNRAGLNPLPESFVKLLRQRTRDLGALLIIDEIITFRVSYGGMQSLFNVQPDITTLGKVIGGGFPVGAVGGTGDVMRTIDPTREGTIAWGGTFSANPVTMAAGLAALNSYGEEAIADLNRKTDTLRSILADAGIKYSGQGSLIRVFPEDMNQTWWKAYDAGVLLGTNGLIALSTAMDDQHISLIGDYLVGAIDSARSSSD